LKMPFLACR